MPYGTAIIPLEMSLKFPKLDDNASQAISEDDRNALTQLQADATKLLENNIDNFLTIIKYKTELEYTSITNVSNADASTLKSIVRNLALVIEPKQKLASLIGEMRVLLLLLEVVLIVVLFIIFGMLEVLMFLVFLYYSQLWFHRN